MVPSHREARFECLGGVTIELNLSQIFQTSAKNVGALYMIETFHGKIVG